MQKHLCGPTLAAVIAIILFFSGCLDEIRLDPPAGFEKSIVVESKLSKAEISSVSVNIGQVFDFDGFTDYFSIRQVSLSDNEGNSVEIPWIRNQFYYKILGDEFPIEYGKSYAISVDLADGAIIESSYSTLRPIQRNNSLRYEIITKMEPDDNGDIQSITYIQYYYKTLLSPDLETKYHHDITRTFRFTDYPKPRSDRNNNTQTVPLPSQKRNTCFVTDNLNVQDTRLIDPKGFNIQTDEQGFYETMIYEEPINWLYAEDYAFTVIQESIDSFTHNYYNKITQLLNFTGGMFQAAPGRVNSNMRYLNDDQASVFGYFYATDQDTTRLYIPRHEVGRPDTLCLLPPPAVSSGEILSPEASCRWIIHNCCDCTFFNNSSYTKPHFWED